MRKMVFFFGILSLYEGKEGAHIFPSLFGVATLHEKRSNTSQRRKQIIITSKEDENTTPHTFCAHTNIIMSFNFGNDGATQFQGGGYGCVNCLLYFLPPVRIRTRDDESFWKHF